MNPAESSDRSSEGVFVAARDRVAALLELGTSGQGDASSPGGQPPPGADAAPDLPGYQITGKLGEGGMGTVWRAVQLSTRREVALKLVGGADVGSQRARLRFEREVELAARLEHPCIARVYDSGISGGLYYYAMELVEGRHLDIYVREEKLDRKQTLALFREVCLAVQHAHQRGVIHRDLKPSNVLVTAHGTPKVLDFGLAKAIEESEGGLTLTIEGHWAGTPAFMAPEQAAGKSEAIDTRTDVYGLGATLYFLLTGHSPHDLSGPRYEVMRRIANEEVRPPRQLRPDVRAELNAIVLKALATDPEKRYASVEALGGDIRNYLCANPVTARPQTLPYVMCKALRKHIVPIATACTIIGVLVGTGFWSYRRERQQRLAAVKARMETQYELADARILEARALTYYVDSKGKSDRRLREALSILESLDLELQSLSKSGDEIRFVEDFPLSVHKDLAVTHVQARQFALSIPWFEKLPPATMNGPDQQYALLHGYALWGVGRFEDAVGVWRRALVHGDPDVPGNLTDDLSWVLCAAEEGGDPDPFTGTASVRATPTGLSSQFWERSRGAWAVAMEARMREKSDELARSGVSKAQVLAERGIIAARLGRFTEAAQDFKAALELSPENQGVWHQGVPIQLAAGDSGAYRALRSLELKKFNDSAGGVAHRVAKDCLIIPAEGDELKSAARLADRALADNPTWRWSFQTKGMAEFRLGNYDQAIIAFNKAIKTEVLMVWCEVACEFFLSMAYHNTGREGEARAAFQHGVRTMDTRLPKPGKHDLGGMVADWVLCQSARREAENLIGTAGAASLPLPTPPVSH